MPFGVAVQQNNNGGVARTAFLPAVVLRRQAPFFSPFLSFSSSLLAQVGISNGPPKLSSSSFSGPHFPRNPFPGIQREGAPFPDVRPVPIPLRTALKALSSPQTPWHSSSIFLSALDLTAVSTALPTITAALNGGDSFTWVGSAYSLASTAFLPLSGALADIFGRKPVMLGSILFFALGSALAGAAQDMNMLIGARSKLRRHISDTHAEI